MHYVYTKTEEVISKDNIFVGQLNTDLSEFERKNPALAIDGVVVLASACSKGDIEEKKKIILKNLERK